MSYLSQIFWKYFWDISLLILNNFRFLVCLSVCSLPHFLTEYTFSVITLSLTNKEIRVTLYNLRFLVCLSVCSLPHLLTEITLSVISSVRDELSFSNFLEIFLGYFYLSFKCFQISCMSVSLCIASLPY